MNRQIEHQQRYARVAVLALKFAGVVSLLVFGILIAYAEPLADEFCFATLEPLNRLPGWEPAVDIVQYNVQLYWKLSGRWLGPFLLTIATRSGVMTMYSLSLAVLLLLNLGCLWYFLRFFFPEAGRWFATAATAVFSLLLWSTMPLPGDSVFWFSGHLTNITPPALFLVVVVWLCGKKIGIRRGAGVVLLAAGLPLLHEITGLMLLGMLCAGEWRTYAKARDRRRQWWWMAAALLTLGALYISSNTPGNAVRLELENPGGFSWRAGLGAAARQARDWWPETLLRPGLWAVTALFVLDSRIRLYRPAWVEQYLAGGWKWVSLAGWGTAVLTIFMLPSLIRANDLSSRTLTQVHIYFLLGWFFHVFVFTRKLAGEPMGERWIVAVQSAALAILAGSVLLTGNTMTAYGDILHRVRPWSAAVAGRGRTLRAAGTIEVTVPPLPRRPFLYFATDLTEDPAHWRNRCVAAYYGVKAVRTASEGSNETRSPGN